MTTMKYYVFTFSLEGAPIAMRLEKEGNDVTLCVIHDQKETLTSLEAETPLEVPFQQSRRLRAFDGLVKRKISAEDAMAELLSMPPTKRQDVFVFFDSNTAFRFAQRLRGQGFKGNAPTEEDRLFEVDRKRAKDFVKMHYPGVSVGETVEFKSAEEAKEFVKATEECWVVKSNSDAIATFVPAGDDVETCREEVLTHLEAMASDLESAGFLLEPKIMQPVEVTPQAVFYNGKLLYTSIDLEVKRLGDEDLGAMTACAADLVLPMSEHAKLAEIAFPEKIWDLASAHDGLFFWDISLIFDRVTGKAYMGEFCPNRPGYNSFYTELTLAPSATQWFQDVVAGKNPMLHGKMAGASVRIFNIPSFEGTSAAVPEDKTLLFGRNALSGIWLLDGVREGELIKSNGYSWNQAVMTGAGADPGIAARQAFGRLEDFALEGGMHRTMLDFLTTGYPTSILSRLKWLAEAGYFDEDET